MPGPDLTQQAEALQQLLGAAAVVYWQCREAGLAQPLGMAPPGLLAGGFLPPEAGDGVRLAEGEAGRVLLPLMLRARTDASGLHVAEAICGGGQAGILCIWHAVPPGPQTAAALELARAALASQIELLGARDEARRTDVRRLGGMADALPQGVVIVPAGNRPGYINRMAAALLGLPAGEAAAGLLATRLADLAGRALNSEEVQRQVKAFVDGRGDVALAGQTWRLSGCPSALRVTVAPIDPGRATGWVWLLEDVSAAEAEADARRRQQQWLWLALSAARAGTWEWDLASDEVHWSQEVWQLHGLAEDGSRSNYGTWLAAMHPEDRAGCEDEVRAAIAEAREFAIEWRLDRADGPERWLMSRGHPLAGPDGRPERYLGIVLDITEAKQAEVRQRQLNRTLTLLSETNTALLYAENEEQLLPKVCQLVVEAGGYRMAWVGLAEQDAARSVRPVACCGDDRGYLDGLTITWSDTESGRGPVGTAIRTGRTQISQHTLSEARLGPWREEAVKRGYFAIIGLPLVLENQVVGALGIYAGAPEAFGEEEVGLLEKLARNLSFGIERLRTRIRLASANRELQSFTYAASHDMKAPLARIVSFGNLLDMNYGHCLEGDGRLYLDFIRQNAQRITSLIEDLLAHARIEQQILHCEPLSLRHAVDAILQEKQVDIEENGVRLRADLPDLRVLAHPLGLAQVLRNLIENALKYSARACPPAVEIGAGCEGRFCRLWVRDNGVGFDMAYHDRIFEIFQRLHSASEFSGTGIGLALVKKAVDRMGGRVWADSAPGQGATFFLELPLASGNSPASA